MKILVQASSACNGIPFEKFQTPLYNFHWSLLSWNSYMKIFQIFFRLHISDDESSKEKFHWNVSCKSLTKEREATSQECRQEISSKFFINETMPNFNPFMSNASYGKRNGSTIKPNQIIGILEKTSPLFNFNHRHQQQQSNHLLNHTNQSLIGKFEDIHKSNLSKCTIITQPKLHFSEFSASTHHQNSNQILHKPREQLIPKHIPLLMSVINGNAESRAEINDPENHIYEMIDEHEVSRNVTKARTHPTTADETNHHNLFQNLLRAEMISQMQSCSKIGNTGYLSHLPQDKRMDIIQETALSLATAAYLEKFVSLFI